MGRLGHAVDGRGLLILGDGGRAAAPKGEQAGRPVVPHPGEDHADPALAAALGHAVEEDVGGRTVEGHGLVEQRQPAAPPHDGMQPGRRHQDHPGPELGAVDGELDLEGGLAAHPTEEAVHEAGLQVLDDDDRALQTNQAGENPGQGRGAAGGGRQSDHAIGAALRASDGGARLPDHQSPEPLAAALREVAEGTEPLAQLRSDREIPLGGVGHHLHGAGDNRRHGSVAALVGRDHEKNGHRGESEDLPDEAGSLAVAGEPGHVEAHDVGVIPADVGHGLGRGNLAHDAGVAIGLDGPRELDGPGAGLLGDDQHAQDVLHRHGAHLAGHSLAGTPAAAGPRPDARLSARCIAACSSARSMAARRNARLRAARLNARPSNASVTALPPAAVPPRRAARPGQSRS